ncbi:MAG: FAD-binding oxidoreductase [Methanomassiliicoccales archaeon]
MAEASPQTGTQMTALPKRRPTRGEYAVGMNEEVNPNVNIIRFIPTNGHMFEFDAGQFVSISAVKPDGKRLARDYSIFSPPSFREGFELCVKRVEGGFMSNFLCDAKVGDKINAIGPMGGFVIRRPLKPEIFFVATGTGIAPFRAMLETLFDEGVTDTQLYLIFGTRHQEDIIYRSYFEKLAAEHPNFHYLPTLSKADDGWQGHRGHVQDTLFKYLDDPSGKEVYICGLQIMVDEVKDLAIQHGVPATNVYYERYD